jgi:hypothetical protein
MGGIRTAKSSIQNCVGKGFAVGLENSSRSPKAGEGRVSVADIGPLFLNSGMRGEGGILTNWDSCSKPLPFDWQWTLRPTWSGFGCSDLQPCLSVSPESPNLAQRKMLLSKT